MRHLYQYEVRLLKQQARTGTHFLRLAQEYRITPVMVEYLVRGERQLYPQRRSWHRTWVS